MPRAQTRLTYGPYCDCMWFCSRSRQNVQRAPCLNAFVFAPGPTDVTCGHVSQDALLVSPQRCGLGRNGAAELLLWGRFRLYSQEHRTLASRCWWLAVLVALFAEALRMGDAAFPSDTRTAPLGSERTAVLPASGLRAAQITSYRCPRSSDKSLLSAGKNSFFPTFLCGEI